VKHIPLLRRTILLVIAALMVALMVSAMAGGGTAFAVTCAGGPVTANDQAQGCFNTALGTANDASNRNADFGLREAFMHNTQP
jgi:hypothetical protein